jgi:hypothetical protein
MEDVTSTLRAFYEAEEQFERLVRVLPADEQALFSGKLGQEEGSSSRTQPMTWV